MKLSTSISLDISCGITCSIDMLLNLKILVIIQAYNIAFPLKFKKARLSGSLIMDPKKKKEPSKSSWDLLRKK